VCGMNLRLVAVTTSIVSHQIAKLKPSKLLLPVPSSSSFILFRSMSASTPAASTLATRSLRSSSSSSSTKRAASSDGAAETPSSLNKKTVGSKKSKTSPKVAKVAVMAMNAEADDVNQPWCNFFTKGDVEYNDYMQNEWSREKHSDVALFEKISLEGAQSGLSWLTILRKREAYRRTFMNFDPVKVALMTAKDVDRIMAENPTDTRPVVVRHRGKIESVIHNAQCILNMRAEQAVGDANSTGTSTTTTKFGVLDDFLWSFVNHKPILNSIRLSNVPTKSEESEAMSKALKQRFGFKFVGPTTCYALMQATGMVIDHPYDTPEWHEARQRLEQRVGGYQDRTTPK
jgi:DNA-3-methyladenine glycosylase I